ncbi:MAG: SEC-C metal-binding domain-containing protein [Anaerolineales bacterium]
MRRFGGQNVSNLMERLKIDEMLPIEHGIVNKTIEQSQTRVEGANFDVRKHLLEYDDVLNDQREKFYEQRNRIFTKEDPGDDLQEMLATEVQRRVDLAAMEDDGWWKLLSWLNTTQPTLQRLDGRLLFSYSIELLLNEMGAQVPALEAAWQVYARAVTAAQESNRAPGDASLRKAAQSAADDARRGLQQAAAELPAVKQTLLDIAAHSAASAREKMLAAVEAQLENLSERAAERAKYKRELAEMAYEGALNEAYELGRPLQVRAVAKDMIETAAVKLALSRDELQDLTPDNVRTAVAQRVESVAGSEIVNATVRRLSARTGLDVEIEVPVWEEIDWDALIDATLDQLEAAHDTQTARHLRDIERILDARLVKPEHFSRDALGRLVMDMAYSQDVEIDQRSKQRRVRLQQRFPYVYYGGQLLEGVEPEELSARILAHLNEAQTIQHAGWGEAELQRLSTARVADLDADTRAWLQAKLDKDDSAALAEQTFGSLKGLLRERVRAALGKRIAIGAHRQLMLSISGQLWVDYLTEIEGIRTSIGLEAYAQRDPLVAYKRRAYDQFRQLLADMRAGVVSRLFTFQPRNLDELRADVERTSAPEEHTHKNLGRNDPCWCGSGKKYKNCHMRTESGASADGNGAAAQRPHRPAAGAGKPTRSKKKKKRKKQKQR